MTAAPTRRPPCLPAVTIRLQFTMTTTGSDYNATVPRSAATRWWWRSTARPQHRGTASYDSERPNPNADGRSITLSQPRCRVAGTARLQRPPPVTTTRERCSHRHRTTTPQSKPVGTIRLTSGKPSTWAAATRPTSAPTAARWRRCLARTGIGTTPPTRTWDQRVDSRWSVSTAQHLRRDKTASSRPRQPAGDTENLTASRSRIQDADLPRNN